MNEENVIKNANNEQLRQFIERIEWLEEEKEVLSQGIREVYLVAKGNGFDVKIMRKIIKLRKMDSREIDEEEVLMELYKRALGMSKNEAA